MRRGKGKGAPSGSVGVPPVPDVDFAVNLHRIVAQSLPRRTEVDSIPASYLQTFWKPFPIPPEVVPAGPGGLAAVLQRDFGHLLSFSQNRQGVWCADLVFAPETALEEIARFHIDFRTGKLQPPPIQSSSPQGPAPAAIVQPPPTIQTKTLSKEEEASAQLLLKGLHKVLLAFPDVGQADSIADLQRRLREGFYRVFNLPLVLSSGLAVDPVELIRKNQQKSFSRILEDPMTGAASVKAIGDNPQFVPVGSVTIGSSVSPQVTPQQRQGPPMQAAMKQLRQLLAENLMLVDKGLAGPVSVPDPNLWNTALATLIQQETQTRDILVSLFK